MAAAKKTKKRVRLHPKSSERATYKEAWGAAVGAALGALLGASFVRDPKSFMDLGGELVKFAGNPEALQSALDEMLRPNEWSGKIDAEFDPPKPKKRASKKKPL